MDRTILLLTYRDPESRGDEVIQLATVAAPTMKQALAMMKEQAKECFRQLEQERGDPGDFKLRAYRRFEGRHAPGESIGIFEIYGADGSGPCEDDFIVSTVKTGLVM